MLFPIKLAEQEGKQSAPKNIQLLRVGDFIQEDGKKLKISTDLLSSLKKNFDNNARGYPDKKLPIDYFHENDKIAAAWISSLALSDDGQSLYADVEWTPRGEQMVSDRELRYVSVEFDFDYRHNEGGKKFGPTLFGAGLTNRPFVKGMNPVTLSEGEYSMMTLEQAMAKIAELEAKIKSMTGESEQMSTEMGDMKKELSEAKKQLVDVTAKAEADKKLAEVTNSFNKMLAEGKACEAQREAFIAGDMVKFAENAKPVNPGVGNSGAADKKDDQSDAQTKILSLAEGIAKDKKIAFKDAISIALSENKELADKYHKETATH